LCTKCAEDALEVPSEGLVPSSARGALAQFAPDDDNLPF
jgi:hypothetical protein